MTTNPYLHFDRIAEELMIAMEENASQHPDKIFDIKQVVAEDHLVAVHSHL